METINSAFTKAENLYWEAKEEFSKPEEDIVIFSICQKSFEAITRYLNVFLSNKNISVTQDAELPELISLAQVADERFKNIGLNLLNHQYDTEDVWMNPETAKAYIILVEEIRKLIGLK